MARFNLGHKLIGLFNSMFGSNVQTTENGEDRDDVTLLDETKTAMESYRDGIQNQINDLKTKADAHDALVAQVADLQTQITTAAENHSKAIAEMQTKFDQKLVNLRKEVRAELVKEKNSDDVETTTDLDDAGKETKKEHTVDLWKADQSPVVTVG